MDKLESIITVLLGITAIIPVLKKNIKGPWIFFMLKAFMRTGRLYKKTRWGRRNDGEAKYVKSIIILSAIYLNLKQKFPAARALEVMNQVVLRLSHAIDYATARKNLLFTIKNPFERWLKYRTILITEGFGLYNDVQDVYINKSRMHYIVKRCIFHDTFVETGTPELTALICDYDKSFHSSMFPEFYFDRNGAWENTIGHGADVCHYVWKDKIILTREFRQYLESGDKTDNRSTGEKKDERRRNVRRKYDRRQQERRQFQRRQKERRRA